MSSIATLTLIHFRWCDGACEMCFVSKCLLLLEIKSKWAIKRKCTACYRLVYRKSLLTHEMPERDVWISKGERWIEAIRNRNIVRVRLQSPRSYGCGQLTKRLSSTKSIIQWARNVTRLAHEINVLKLRLWIISSSCESTYKLPINNSTTAKCIGFRPLNFRERGPQMRRIAKRLHAQKCIKTILYSTIEVRSISKCRS